MGNFRAHNLRLASQRLAECVAALREAHGTETRDAEDDRGIIGSIERLAVVSDRIDEITVASEGNDDA